MEKSAFLKKQKAIMSQTKDVLFIKFAITGIAALLDTFLVILRLPTFVLAIFGILFSGVIYFVCRNDINDAFLSIFKWNANHDAFFALGLFAVFIRSFTLFFVNGGNTEIFSPALFISVSISFLLKRIFANEVLSNVSETDKKDVSLIGNFKDENKTKCAKLIKTDFVPDIVEKSYMKTPSDKNDKIFVPVIYGLILILSLITMFSKGFSMFFTALAAFSIIASSFSGEFSFVFPYVLIQKKMRKNGMMLFGYSSISSLKKTEAVVIDGNDLYPPENVSIKKIKIKNKNTEKVVKYVNRILSEADSSAKGVFDGLDILEGGIPLTVKDMKFIPERGIMININEDDVMFGNRNLLLENGVEPYTQEKEAFMMEENSVMMYLSINKNLEAALLFEYIPNEEFRGMGDDFDGLEVIIKTKDAAVNTQSVGRDFGIRKSDITITDDKYFEFVKNTEDYLVSAGSSFSLMTTNGAKTLPFVISLSKTVSTVIRYSVLSKYISIVFGILLCFAALLISPANMSFVWLLLYNAVWLLPTVAVATYKNNR